MMGISNIDIAENGKEAVSKFIKNKYDLILMDCQMPVLNGYDATRQIKVIEKQQGTNTTIYALTASTKENDKQLCLDIGMAGIITKPINYKQFSKVIKTFFKHRETLEV